MKKWELLHLTLDNSNSDKGQGYYRIEQKMFKTRRGQLSNVNFVQKGARRLV